MLTITWIVGVLLFGTPNDSLLGQLFYVASLWALLTLILVYVAQTMHQLGCQSFDRLYRLANRINVPELGLVTFVLLFIRLMALFPA